MQTPPESVLTAFDRALFRYINGGLNNPLLDVTMPFLSAISNVGAIWLLIIAALVAVGLKRGSRTPLTIALAGFVAFAISAVAGEIIEEIAARARPFDVLESVRLIVPEKDSFSLPSGTTTAAFAASTGMVLAARRLSKSVGWWGWLMLILAAFTGYSRVYVGVHWPTDVLAGAVLGGAGGIIGSRSAVLAMAKVKAINFRKRLGERRRAPRNNTSRGQ